VWAIFLKVARAEERTRDLLFSFIFSFHHLTQLIHSGSPGDQIVRIFEQRATVYFGQLLESYRSVPDFFGYFIPRLSSCINFAKKMGWATFWAIFSQTHLAAVKANPVAAIIAHGP
jgi:hypothetical protein